MRPIQRYRQELAREQMAKEGYTPNVPAAYRPNRPQLIGMALTWRMPDGSIFTQEGVHAAVAHLEPAVLLEACDEAAQAHYRDVLTKRTPA